jgi:hypothetical protein
VSAPKSAHDSPEAPSIEFLRERIGALDEHTVDLLYGLEPVFEPGSVEAGAALGAYVEYQCPYCCETIGASVDLTDGSRSYIEDCQVCCQPIALTLQVDAHGELLGLEAERAD